MIFKQSAMVAISFLKTRKQFFHRKICKFGEDIFINEWDIKVYEKKVTNGQIHRHVYMHACTESIL